MERDALWVSLERALTLRGDNFWNRFRDDPENSAIDSAGLVRTSGVYKCVAPLEHHPCRDCLT
jgi:hypothetical protein